MREVQVQSSPRGKNFPRVTCIRAGGERGSKKVSFTRERTAVGSNPLGNEKTNGSGPVRNRVRSATFLDTASPSFSRSMTRELGDPSIVVCSGDIATSTSRGQPESRDRPALNVDHGYLKKGKISFFPPPQYPRLHEASLSPS